MKGLPVGFRTTIGPALALAAFAGCGAPTYDVAGTITSRGKPVPEARVAFYDASGAIAGMAATDASGAYRLADGLKPGAYDVAVFPIAVEVASLSTPRPDDVSADLALAAVSPPPFPEKYLAPGTSGLEREIAEGVNRFDFALD